jgi:hypothetical protein
MRGSEWRRAGDAENLVIDAGVIMSYSYFFYEFPKSFAYIFESPKRTLFVLKWDSAQSISRT